MQRATMKLNWLQPGTQRRAPRHRGRQMGARIQGLFATLLLVGLSFGCRPTTQSPAQGMSPGAANSTASQGDADPVDAAKTATSANLAADATTNSAVQQPASAKASSTVDDNSAPERSPTVTAAAQRPRGRWDAPRVLLLTPRGPWLLEFEILVGGQVPQTLLEKSAQELLKKLDTDADGSVTWNELTLSAPFRENELGGEQPRSEADRLSYIQVRDRNRNKLVDIDEIAGLFALGEMSSRPISLVTVRDDPNPLRTTSSLFQLLDQDEDGRLDAADWKRAPERLASRDANDDDQLDPVEIRRGSDRRDRTMGGSMARAEGMGADLAWLIDDETDWSGLLRTLRERYSDGKPIAPEHFPHVARLFQQLDENGNERLSVTELPRLQRCEPHVVWRVELRATDRASEQRLTVMRRQKEPDEELELISTASGWQVRSAGLRLEWQLIDGGAEGTEDRALPIQIRFAAVADALWDLLDTNGDGRLNLREMREAAQRLAALDQDQSGDLTTEDLPLTWRGAIQRGGMPDIPNRPAVARPRPADGERGELPDWFVRMDTDGDGLLSRREWLGSRTQFLNLDRNQDEQLSWSEVSAVLESADEKTSPTVKSPN